MSFSEVNLSTLFFFIVFFILTFSVLRFELNQSWQKRSDPCGCPLSLRYFVEVRLASQHSEVVLLASQQLVGALFVWFKISRSRLRVRLVGAWLLVSEFVEVNFLVCSLFFWKIFHEFNECFLSVLSLTGGFFKVLLYLCFQVFLIIHLVLENRQNLAVQQSPAS